MDTVLVSETCDLKTCQICNALTYIIATKEERILTEHLKKTVATLHLKSSHKKYKRLKRRVRFLEAELASARQVIAGYQEDTTLSVRDALLTRVQAVIAGHTDNFMAWIDADVFIAEALQKNRVLEMNVAELVLRNTNLSYRIGEEQREKEGLTKEIFDAIIGFPIGFNLEDMERINSALAWYCVRTRGNATDIARHFESWASNTSIEKELYAIVDSYIKEINP